MKGFVKGFLVTLGVLAAIAFIGVMNNTWTWAAIIIFCTSEAGKIILFCVGVFLLVVILMKISKSDDSTKVEEEKAELIKILLK